MFRKELVFKRSVFLQVFHQGYWVKVESAVSTYRRIGKCSCFGRRRGSLLWHSGPKVQINYNLNEKGRLISSKDDSNDFMKFFPTKRAPKRK